MKQLLDEINRKVLLALNWNATLNSLILNGESALYRMQIRSILSQMSVITNSSQRQKIDVSPIIVTM